MLKKMTEKHTDITNIHLFKYIKINIQNINKNREEFVYCFVCYIHFRTFFLYIFLKKIENGAIIPI